MDDDKLLIARIIKRHGPVIDLRQTPSVIIDIIRRFADDIPDGGTPCGGTPPSPPPGPTSFQDRVSNEDIMKQLLRLSRAVGALQTKKAKGRRTGRRGARR